MTDIPSSTAYAIELVSHLGFSCRNFRLAYISQGMLDISLEVTSWDLGLILIKEAAHTSSKQTCWASVGCCAWACAPVTIEWQH